MSLRLETISKAFSENGIIAQAPHLKASRTLILHAIATQRALNRTGKTGGSAIAQDLIEIAQSLGLSPKRQLAAIRNAICSLALKTDAWGNYFRRTANLQTDRRVAKLFESHGFHPVKISWEDIGRDEGSCWGSRISDVGIWGRESPKDLDSSRLMLTVRRDDNFRDRVLMVPSENIKLHRSVNGRLQELSLPQRLRELGLLSSGSLFDKNVVVSNQFSIVPIPRKGSDGPDTLTFNFSVFTCGSTNFVIADTIEGSSEVVVGPGEHQLIYFNADGKKAPFTAARASQRQEVVAAADAMKKAGLDVDVQRFYLIQVPLTSSARIRAGNMGSPPLPDFPVFLCAAPAGLSYSPTSNPGLESAVLGHGDDEGDYQVGSGFSGKRADERVRVTVCYFVTPRAKITASDMNVFASRFAEWDEQSIWGGSFVVPGS